MAFGDGDLAVFFGLTGVPVDFGVQSTRGNLDEADVTGDVAGLLVQDVSHKVELARGSLDPMPEAGDRVSVDGRPFTVREADAIDDGAIIRLTLKKGWKAV